MFVCVCVLFTDKWEGRSSHAIITVGLRYEATVLPTSSLLLIVGSHYLTSGREWGRAVRWGRRGGRGGKERIHVMLSNWNSSYPVSLYNLIQIPQSVARSYLNEHLTKSLLCFCFSWPAFGRLPRSIASEHPGRCSANWRTLCILANTQK